MSLERGQLMTRPSEMNVTFSLNQEAGGRMSLHP